MKHFIKSLTPSFNGQRSQLRKHILPFLVVVSVLMAIYICSRTIPAGLLTWSISALCLLVVGITALARVNDISQEQIALRWQARRGGLILVGAACIGITLGPWLGPKTFTVLDWPSWGEVMFRMGIALTWLTTPMMPPWHRYISGEYRKQVIEVPEDVEVEIRRAPTSSISPDMYDSGEK